MRLVSVGEGTAGGIIQNAQFTCLSVCLWLNHGLLQLVVRVGLEPGTSGFQVRRPNHLTTVSRFATYLLLSHSHEPRKNNFVLVTKGTVLKKI